MPAKIYDEDFVKSELQEMLQELKNNEQIYLINQLFFDKNYSRSRFHEWRKDFANNEYIRTLLEQIEGILENRIAHGALIGRLNSSMSMFVLKNKYGWTSNPENKSQETAPLVIQIRGYKEKEDNA